MGVLGAGGSSQRALSTPPPPPGNENPASPGSAAAARQKGVPHPLNTSAGPPGTSSKLDGAEAGAAMP